MRGLGSKVAHLASGIGARPQEACAQPEAPLDEFRNLSRQLADQGLLCSQTLLLIAHDGVRVVFDQQEQPVRSPLFDAIKAPLAVFTPGLHAQTYAKRGLPVRASIDDAAQLFGPELPCMDLPAKNGPAFLIRDCGLLATGRFAGELVAAAVLADKLCGIELMAPALGTAHYLNTMLCAAEHGVYRAAYSRHQLQESSQRISAQTATEDTSADLPDSSFRLEVIAYGQRLVDEHLIQATWGNVSVRVDDDHFLISPSGVDYHTVTPREVVPVYISDGSYPKGLRPSSERRMHQLIYQARPDIRAIVHTHSSHCAVFAACHQDLLTEVLDYPCAPYAVSGSAQLADNVAHVMLGHDGCILANHGLVTAGDTLEQAFERAREAEAAAERRLRP